MAATLGDIKLVHIGLHKTGSTYLQNLWRRDPSINLSHAGILPLVEAVRRHCLHGEALTDTDWQFDKPMTGGQDFLISNEGLSALRYLPGITREQFLQARGLFAEIMKMLAPRAKILIVAREPHSWLHSIHRQYLQEGGSLGFGTYVNKAQGALEAGLDLRQLYRVWALRFGEQNVRVLPYGWLRDDPVAFLQEVEAFAGVQTALCEIGHSSNVTPDAETLEFLRTFNRLFEGCLHHAGIKGEGLDKLDALRQGLHWELRRQLHTGTPAIKRYLRRVSRAGRAKPRTALPESLQLTIDRDHLGFLADIAASHRHPNADRPATSSPPAAPEFT